jgi:predicted 2-oxoglutarate/Fe(II)-dependent dioxygenase YbiX
MCMNGLKTMKKSPTNLFSDHFFYQFSAPNAEQINTALRAEMPGDATEWSQLCDVKVQSLNAEKYIELIGPSLQLLSDSFGVKLYYECHNPWVNHYTRGQFQEVHDHKDCDLVCVYFANQGVDFSKFYFYNRHATLSPIWKNALGCNDTYVIEYDAGDIIFFPGHMLHGVTPHNSDETRITFSANLWLSPL